MRAVIQRVERAAVYVNRKKISAIERGVLVLLGVEINDLESEADYLADKIIHLRIFEDQEGKMNLSLRDVDGGMLVVSQFTLLADTKKGRRPSFVKAEAPQRAKALYDYFLRSSGKKLKNVAGGEFQAMMKVDLVNDGPVTIILDTK